MNIINKMTEKFPDIDLETIKTIISVGFDNGYMEGYRNGNYKGYNDGYDNGYDNGIDDIYEN